jgi:hypothetical protein
MNLLRRRIMQENTPPGGATNSEQFRTGTTAETSRVKDQLRQAGTAATDALRSRAYAAGDTVRARASDAQDWARSQWGGIQGRVEARPGMAALWALGIGLAAGLLLSSLARGGRR